MDPTHPNSRIGARTTVPTATMAPTPAAAFLESATCRREEARWGTPAKMVLTVPMASRATAELHFSYWLKKSMGRRRFSPTAATEGAEREAKMVAMVATEETAAMVSALPAKMGVEEVKLGTEGSAATVATEETPQTYLSDM
jgi:hypothetical protein